MDLADLYVSILPDTDRFGPDLNRKLKRAGEQAGELLAKTLTGGVQGSSSKMTKAGQDAGRKTGDAVAKTMTERLRSSTGRFVKVGEEIGTKTGKGIGDRITTALKNNRWATALKNNRALQIAAVGAGTLAGSALVRKINSTLTGTGGTGVGGGGVGRKVGLNLSKSLVSGLKGGGIAGAVAGLLGGGILAGGKTLADRASDLNETVSKTRTIFGASSASIERWSKNSARALGLSRNEALTGASAFGNLFDQLGFAEGASVKMSKSFLQMSADAASFSNANPADVMDAFLSATRGEYDALQRYIPTVNAAKIEAEALRASHKKAAKDLTDADKATALYALSVKGLGKATGDFARTSEGYANQQRIFKANMADLAVQVGQYVLPIFNRFTTSMNDKGFPALTRIVTVSGKVATSLETIGRAAVVSLGGDFAEQIDGASTNLTELAEWFETHEADILGFFVAGANGVLNFSRGIATLVSGGIRGFGQLSGGLADFLDGAIPGIQGVLDGFASVVEIFDKDAAESIRAASVKLGEGGKVASAGLRNTRDRANDMANDFDRKVFPALDRAQKRLNDVAQTKIFEAEQRDATRAAKIALDNIGTGAGGAQVKMKSLRDITEGNSTASVKLRDRLVEARNKLIDQRLAGEAAGASQKLLTTRWERGKEAIYREGRQMGLSKIEARKLAEQYGKVPSKVETTIRTPKMPEALRAAKLLRERINNLPNKTVVIDFKSNAGDLAYAYGIQITKGVRAKQQAKNSQGTGGGYADGGVMPGWTPGRDVHHFTSPTGGELNLSGGEPVLRPEWLPALGGKAGVDAMNKAARTGQLSQSHAGGGTIARTITANTSPWPGRPDFNTLGNNVSRALGEDIAKALQAKLTEAVGAGMGGGGGGPIGAGGFAKALGWARTQDPKPYRWAQAGPGGYDCSGFMSAIANYIQGRPLYGRRFSTGQAGGNTLGGFTRNKMSPFRIGVVKGNPGHTAGTLNGVNVESRGGEGVVIGPRARGWNNRLFTMHYGLKSGGVWEGDPAFDYLDPRGKHTLPWVDQLGMDSRRLAPGLATGGTVMRDGWARVGERGPETIYANKGDRVVPGGPQTIKIYLDGAEVFSETIDDEGEFRASLARMGRR